MNHCLWEGCISPLTPQQFHEPLAYSAGPVRNQVVHLINIEERRCRTLRAFLSCLTKQVGQHKGVETCHIP
jgi:hypothetical protein